MLAKWIMQSDLPKLCCSEHSGRHAKLRTTDLSHLHLPPPPHPEKICLGRWRDPLQHAQRENSQIKILHRIPQSIFMMTVSANWFYIPMKSRCFKMISCWYLTPHKLDKLYTDTLHTVYAGYVTTHLQILSTCGGCVQKYNYIRFRGKKKQKETVYKMYCQWWTHC